MNIPFSATINLRYDEFATLDLNQPTDEIIFDLCYIVKGCMHGRTNINPAWVNIMNKYNVTTDF